MLSQFHRLPDLAILAAIVTLLASLGFVSPFLGFRLLRLRENKERDGAAFDAFKAIMAMAGVVLAFSLVQADNNLRASQAIVDREANAMLIADRSLLRFGAPQVLEDRSLLAEFGRSQLRNEWPTLADRGRNADTEARYTALSRAVRVIEPQSRREEVLYTEMIKAIDDISDERDTLIMSANAQLPSFFWTVSISFVLLGLILGMLSEASVTRAVALSGTAAGIGLLLSFVLIVDQPFKGQTSVNTKSIEKALLLNSHRL